MSAGSDSPENKPENELAHALLFPAFDSEFAVLEVIRESPGSSHLVVEDCEYADVYYLRRLVLRRDEAAARTKKYYKNLEEFGRSCLVPVEMVKVLRLEETSNPLDQTDELLVFSEWGEPDCIDLARLTAIQTLKYLKNINEMLRTVFVTRGITNNNIALHNVVLVGSQLKLSGWKPLIIVDKKPDLDWREYIAVTYGKKRLDLCLLGLLWMQLCEIDVSDILEASDLTFSDFFDRIVDKASSSGKFGVDHMLFAKL